MDGPAPGRPAMPNGRSNMRPAERFKDEERRIIESCFMKKDADGSFLESYITHIRITEDAQHPSSPPPPNSPPDMKKPRLIIVAVRKSGRVRMHKARENSNGTFSIGKTWLLDDLQTLESFNGPSAVDDDRRKWAGPTGFVVTLGKPYFWQASTPKAKQYFLASLVKIYAKYTGGKVPQLTGFDAAEREQMLNSARAYAARNGPPPAAAPPVGAPPPLPSPYTPTHPIDRPGPLPNMRKEMSREGVPRPPQPEVHTPTGLQPRRELGMNSSEKLLAQRSQPQLRKVAMENQSQESFGRSEDAVSLPPRSRQGMDGVNMPGRFPERSATPVFQRTATPERSSSPAPPAESPPVPAPLSIPPERRRPPIAAAPLEPNRDRADSEVTPPVPPVDTSQAQEQVPDESPVEKDVSQPEPELHPEPVQPPVTNIVETVEPEQKAPETPVDAPAPMNGLPISPPEPSTPRDEDRPGLGPMIKKKQSRNEIASKFRNAARAANAFKPRPGGAAERMLQQSGSEKSNEPDGITGVVPAPNLRGRANAPLKLDTPDPTVLEKASAPVLVAAPPPVHAPPEDVPPPPPVPEDSPSTSVPEVMITPSETTADEAAKLPAAPKVKIRDKKTKVSSEMTNKQLAALGIEPAIFDGRGADFVSLLDEFGWTNDGVHTKNIDLMREEVERELNAVQVGSWMTRLDDEDDRVELIKKGLDVCIAECEELDGLLTLYAVELGTLDEDIAYIEAQSQGLQVQTANQKLLQAELESLLETISLSGTELNSLREQSLESSRGLEQIEASLVMLFKAMNTIDPSISLSAARSGDSLNSKVGFGNSEIGSMRVLQEKKDIYKAESTAFLRRLRPFLQVKFAAALDETRKALEREKEGSLSRRAGRVKIDPRNHDLSRQLLWKYSPLMLFTREVDDVEWEEIMKVYEMTARPLFQDEFRDAVFAWKRAARKATGDEGDILFTSQVEKQNESLTTTARKLTVKRSQTLAKTLRSPIGEANGRTGSDKSQEGRLIQYEVVKGLLDEMVPIVFAEQNFVVEFFHVSSLEQLDFADIVAASAPDLRQGGDLRRPKVMDPDREMAKRVIRAMDDLFAFFPGDLQNLVDWCIQADPLQGVGVLVALETKMSELEESSQEFLSRTLQKIHLRLMGMFNKFLDEQLRAIEDTKVKIKKRKGVIGFMRIFPNFSAALETMLGHAEELEIRETVNGAYARIIKTMFESLKVIARENPAAQAGAMMGDPEDKEALNYEILLIENMNHFLEDVETRENSVLEVWKQTAAQEMDEHMALYLGAVIRRPLGKLLDFLESTEALLLSLPAGTSAASVAAKPSHAKATFKKILAGYDGKEIRRGIETLRKRVEKHFGDADDPTLSRGLVAKVLAHCETYYDSVEARIVTISRNVYDGDITLEWTKTDVQQAFRR